MEQSGFTPDETSLASFARVCSSNGNVDLAWKAVKSFADAGNRTALRCYAPVLKGFCDSGKSSCAFEVFEHMEGHNVNPTEEEFVNMIRVCEADPLVPIEKVQTQFMTSLASLARPQAFELMHQMADHVSSCSTLTVQVVSSLCNSWI